MPIAFNIDKCGIDASKHFKNLKMRNWNWDYADLRDAIREAYRIDKIGKQKYEAFTNHGGGSKKIIFVYYGDVDAIFVITGAEGSGRYG